MTVRGNAVSWSVKAPFTVSFDGDGKLIRFSHCPWLTFPSMQYAFDYFNVQANLHRQHVIQPRMQHGLQATQHVIQPRMQDRLQATQHGLQADEQDYLAEDLGLQARKLAAFAVEQDYLAEALYPLEPVFETDTLLKPTDAQSIASLRTQLSHGASESQYQHAAESYTQNERKEHIPFQFSSRSSSPQPPPQTLFAESTPHASEILSRSRLGLPVKGSQPWPSESRRPKDDPFLQPLSSTTSLGSYYQQSIRMEPILPQNLTDEVGTSDQLPNFHASYPLPCSYADTILPQTLHKKDRRVLGVPASACIDEIRAGFWLRDLQYNADRHDAASLEERAAAALKLTRAREALDRLGGCF